MIVKKKGFFLVLMLASSIFSGSQVIIIPEVQTNGVIMKQQLFSVVINNISENPKRCILSIQVTDRATSQIIMEVSSSTLYVNRGVKRVGYNDLLPFTTGMAMPGFSLDQTQNQLIPIGDYLICYRLVDADVKASILALECVKASAEPLSPPQLTLPENQSVLKEIRPFLSWLPPAPVTMFSHLSYDVLVTPLYENQSPQEAMQRNIPVLTTTSFNSSLQYPSSFSNLEAGKTYAWQIVARDGEKYAGKSEVWKFTILPDSVAKMISSAPYIRLSTYGSEVTVAHQGILKMEYFNSLTDSSAQFRIYKISESNRNAKPALTFDLLVKTGQNLLEFNLSKKLRLNENAVYEVRLINSRREESIIKFTPKYYL